MNLSVPPIPKKAMSGLVVPEPKMNKDRIIKRDIKPVTMDTMTMGILRPSR